MASQVSKILLHRFLPEIFLLLLLSLRFSNEINLKMKEILYQSLVPDFLLTQLILQSRLRS